MLPHGFDVPHAIALPAIYEAPPPSRLRARFCPDCLTAQYAARGRALGRTSHYCRPDGRPPMLVHWLAG